MTRYFSYEHFYVLYCRFWELDHDRDYRITREDLLKYGDHSLSHMIVDRIFDSAPRPFEQENVDREYLSYEEFIYFMLSGKLRKDYQDQDISNADDKICIYVIFPLTSLFGDF